MASGGDGGATKCKECGACGRGHSRTEDCPAKGQQCNKCKKFNYFASVCSTGTQKKPAAFKSRKVHTVSDYREQTPPELFIDSITKLHANTTREQGFAEIEVGKARHKLKFKIDKGAQANVAERRKNHCAPFTQNRNAFTHPHRTPQDQKTQAASKRCAVLAWDE